MITMILENDPFKAKLYEQAGIDRIFVDLEINGKQERQGHLDTVISNHSITDVHRVKSVLDCAELLVRVNPINSHSKIEIDEVVGAGADVIMLPMFKSAEEVRRFVSYVDGRATTCLLLETSQALARIDDILSVKGIDEIHIGLNDLHLSLGLDFMFELLSGSIVEFIVDKIRPHGIRYGIGGVAKMDEGILNGQMVITEHVRLSSSMVILSRSFKRESALSVDTLTNDVQRIHTSVENAKRLSVIELLKNKEQLKLNVESIIATKNGR